jgi:uracil-DNA glycosylase
MKIKIKAKTPKPESQDSVTFSNDKPKKIRVKISKPKKVQKPKKVEEEEKKPLTAIERVKLMRKSKNANGPKKDEVIQAFLEQPEVEYPEIPEDISVYEVAKKYTPVGWVDEFETRDKELKNVSDLLEMKCLNETYSPGNLNIFRAFHLTPLSSVRVVILGQDPYPTQGVADGLAFSTSPGEGVPGSLRNIYKEINKSYPKWEIPSSGNLEHWARQGVLLLNTCLTCPLGNSSGHSKYNIWIPFVSYILKRIGKVNKDCFYLLWGKKAQECSQYITGRPERILESSHPSPNSVFRGFSGCGHFRAVNTLLNPPIKW